MSNRRNANNIRGPHSALTDFLAANNISARQIRDDYERRRREADEAEAREREENEEEDDDDVVDFEEAQAIIEQANREREAENKKKGKAKAKTKTKAKKKKDSDDEASNEDWDNHIPYKKVKKLPGQFANCEVCEKRFTVTPYSKTGPDGGLLCSPCGKELDKEAKGANGDKRKAPNGVKGANKRKRNMQSERLDGVVRRGPKSLVQHCLETVVQHHSEIESFENMPDHLIMAICKLFTRQRIMSSDLFPLFLKRENNSVIVYDCAGMFLSFFLKDMAAYKVQHSKQRTTRRYSPMLLL